MGPGSPVTGSCVSAERPVLVTISQSQPAARKELPAHRWSVESQRARGRGGVCTSRRPRNGHLRQPPRHSSLRTRNQPLKENVNKADVSPSLSRTGRVTRPDPTPPTRRLTAGRAQLLTWKVPLEGPAVVHHTELPLPVGRLSMCPLAGRHSSQAQRGSRERHLLQEAPPASCWASQQSCPAGGPLRGSSALLDPVPTSVPGDAPGTQPRAGPGGGPGGGRAPGAPRTPEGIPAAAGTFSHHHGG